MAIYRKGKASIDERGNITGDGTKWLNKLTLIRAGATIIFNTTPLEFATITEIESDTFMRSADASGVAVPMTDYVIFLHDSLTVEGMAQDVAETLRYYQSKETVLEDAIEFFKDFDDEKFEKMWKETVANAAAAAASAQASESSKVQSGNYANAAKVSETNSANNAAEANRAKDAAKASETASATNKNAAAASAAAAKTSETNSAANKDAAAASAKAAKTSETNTNTAKDSAVAAANAARNSETNSANNRDASAASAKAAKTSETNSAASAQTATQKATEATTQANRSTTEADRAKTEADRAADLATQFDATALMRKDANLSDVVDKSQARRNISVDRLTQSAAETLLYSPNNKKGFVLSETYWGFHDYAAGKYIPLSVGAGGTGANDAAGARKNINALYQASSSLTANDNLNNLKGANAFGEYFCGANSFATTANNYPVQLAGHLKVTGTSANGADQTIQEYTLYNSPWVVYRRAYNLVSGSTWAWSKWERQSWRAGDWVSSLKDIPGEGAYRIKGDGADVPTVGAPPGSGNNILNLVVSEVYNNAWLLLAYSGGNDMWIGRYNPQDATPAPVWAKMIREGQAGNFSAVYATNGIEAKLASSDTTTPAPSLVSRRMNGSGATIVSSEMRANPNGSVEWIKRDSGGTPRSIQITANNEVQFNSLVPVPANMEMGRVNPNAPAYIDFNYGAKYDYDARIICDGMNSDQNGGGNLRFYSGYEHHHAKGSYNFEGGRFRVTTSDVSIESPTTISHDSNALNIRPKTAGNAHYIRFNDASKDTGWVGNPSNTADTIGLFSYVFNAGVQISDRIRLTGRDTEVANLFVNGSSVYVRGGAGANNTHLWLQNSSGRNRAVIYSSDTQVLQLRSDNASTGAGGQALSICGATGECRAVKFTATSDERAKFWIKPVTGALDKICSLRGVTYSMHTTIQDTVRNAGVIAQDVQKVLPEAVSVNETGDTLDKQCRQVENPLSLDYNALSALYVEAIKELREEVNALKAEIAELKAK